MNTASKTTVAQVMRPQGAPLLPMLVAARRLYGKVTGDPSEIQLRELPDGACQVICFFVPEPTYMRRLAAKGLAPDADGVVVICEASNWSALGLSRG